MGFGAQPGKRRRFANTGRAALEGYFKQVPGPEKVGGFRVTTTRTARTDTNHSGYFPHRQLKLRHERVPYDLVELRRLERARVAVRPTALYVTPRPYL